MEEIFIGLCMKGGTFAWL